MNIKTLSAYFCLCDSNDPNVDYNDPNFQYETDFTEESLRFSESIRQLMLLKEEMSEENLTFQIYEIAKCYDQKNPRKFFIRTYQVLFGSNDGPRLPTFIKIYGVDNFQKTLMKRLEQLL